ncbi:putative dehydrogenase [Frigoribacterium faeni]|nr:putative dehydrogenase [Frigoribacterium faeni]
MSGTGRTGPTGAAAGRAPAPMRVGVVGVGVISEQYFATFERLPGLALEAVADLDGERAASVASRLGVRALTVDELLADDRVDVVLNLTIPAAHAEIALRAIAAGKHVYGEKPLALTVADGTAVLEAARVAGVRVGSAPDTVLGTGVQTAAQLVASGVVGDPVGAAVSWTASGHEAWHPAPDFYYRPGGGPLFDMGPYYLTTLVHLLGPVESVSGLVSRSARRRTIGTGPRAGQPLEVEVDTHASALLRHVSGAVSTVTVSFEVWGSRAPITEFFGTRGTIAVPDANMFGDPVELLTADDRTWRGVEPTAGYLDAGRGVGLADLARAVSVGEPHRASGDVALHVLEITEAVAASSASGAVVSLVSRPDVPPLVPLGAEPHEA